MIAKVFLIDTSIWVHAFRQSRHPQTRKIQKFLRLLSKEAKLVITGIILAEFIRGLGKRKKDMVVRNILERYEYLPSTKKIYSLAGELARELDLEGLKTPLTDCLIAAIAIAYKVTLLTDDSHFKRFSGLKLKFID